ncbi:MAG: hypothetical protein HYT22_01160 [Candidatus Niyogibacteria bacterium]|nr:hypothetical protein [Candidatus Niyogibacteria bacterium]
MALTIPDTACIFNKKWFNEPGLIQPREVLMQLAMQMLKRVFFFVVFLLFAGAAFFSSAQNFSSIQQAHNASFWVGVSSSFFKVAYALTFIQLCAGLYLLRNAFRSLFPKN